MQIYAGLCRFMQWFVMNTYQELNKVKSWHVTIWSIMENVIKVLWLYEIAQISLLLLTAGCGIVNRKITNIEEEII